MILMWLGSFVLMMFGLSESQKYVALFSSDLQKSLLAKGFDGSFTAFLFRSMGISFLEASPKKTLNSGMALYDFGAVSSRGSILLMCLSSLGSWWTLLLGFLFLSFNGFFVLGFCAFGFLTPWVNSKVELLLKWLLAVGIFLVGGEMTLKNSSIIQTILGQSDLAFFLADGRFIPVLGIMLAGLLLSFVVQAEFWSLALGLALLVTNSLSFNGALGLVVGERIGQMILFWWQSRSLETKKGQRIGKQFAMSSIIGTLVGFLIVGEARSVFYFGFSNDLSSFQNKSLQFVLLFFVILFFQWLGQMVWGHFASQVFVDQSQKTQ